jgi:hypothetical protein
VAARRQNGKVAPADAVRRAVEQVAAMTDRPVEGVLGVRRDDDGWRVELELVELRRVPDSTDVLATYEVALDDGGELREYRRTRRYYRSQVEEER